MNEFNTEVKRKRGRPRKYPEGQPKTPSTQPYRDLAEMANEKKHCNNLPTIANGDKGDNTRFLKNALASWDLPRVDTKDDKAVEERIKMYFEFCAENDIKPQVIGMAQWLGVNRDTLHKWRTGQIGGHQKTLEKAYLVMESLWADYMQNGKINPVSGIFLAKSWFGYKDQTEYVVTPGKAEPISDDDLIAEAKLISNNEQQMIAQNIIDVE